MTFGLSQRSQLICQPLVLLFDSNDKLFQGKT